MSQWRANKELKSGLVLPTQNKNGCPETIFHGCKFREPLGFIRDSMRMALWPL
jgi:hypothetical protein